MRLAARGVVALVGSLWLAAPAPARAQPPAGGFALRLGVMAEEPSEPDHMLRVYEGFVSLLRARLAPQGIGVADLVIARDLQDLSQRLRAGDVDLVIETVFPTLVLARRSGVLEPGLLVVRRGRRVYRSVFFTRKESPIQTLADLRGRTLVLQALRSTSAFALPRAELMRAGLAVVPSDDTTAGREAIRYVLAGAEINQAIWVLHGRGDAGAFNEGDWEALPARVRDQLRIFHQTRPILRGLLSFRSGLSRPIREAVVKLLLHLHEDPEGPPVLKVATGITRFEPLQAADRESLRGWEKTLGPIPSRP
jgi:phosphonate transport system substrate-binding protein